MIPRAYITEWSQQVPSTTNEQVSVDEPPSRQEFIQNMDAKMQDTEFLGDITALIRPELPYTPSLAYELIKTELIERI